MGGKESGETGRWLHTCCGLGELQHVRWCDGGHDHLSAHVTSPDPTCTTHTHTTETHTQTQRRRRKTMKTPTHKPTHQQKRKRRNHNSHNIAVCVCALTRVCERDCVCKPVTGRANRRIADMGRQCFDPPRNHRCASRRRRTHPPTPPRAGTTAHTHAPYGAMAPRRPQHCKNHVQTAGNKHGKLPNQVRRFCVLCNFRVGIVLKSHGVGRRANGAYSVRKDGHEQREAVLCACFPLGRHRENPRRQLFFRRGW